MLLEVFECTGQPGLLLQKGYGTLRLADIPTYKIKVDLEKRGVRMVDINEVHRSLKSLNSWKKFYPCLFQRGYTIEISSIGNYS